MAIKVFKVTCVFLVLWALTKTESGGITCRKGQGDVARDPENYCQYDRDAIWCEAVTQMQLVIECTPCEDPVTVRWTYNGMPLNGTSAQLTLPPDKVVMSASGCYRCSCQGSNGEAAFAVEMRSADVHDYFMKPAQTWVASVEVGNEGYCSVYPEDEVETIYTVCRVPSNDTEVCPLIAQNLPNCCICGNPGCNQALGEGVNTFLGVTPAHAVYPGIDSCIVISEHALMFDCFVQRSSRFGTSLKQHTGTISYYIPLSPTTAYKANQTATEVYRDIVIGLSAALAVAVLVCLVVTCVLLVLLYMCVSHHKRVSENANWEDVDEQGGKGGANGVGGSGDAERAVAQIQTHCPPSSGSGPTHTQAMRMQISSPDMGQVLVESVDEVRLQHLCYMATGIERLLIGPDGGTFTLGCGDATLKFPPGAVEKETLVHYAIILHGPFVLPARCKLGSVVVYINMGGAILMKPFQLLLSHWCVREEEDGKETLKFVYAPHRLEAGQEKYTFEEEEEADFATFSDVGILTIREPHCLFCVKTNRETIAKYSAITFSRYTQSEDTLLFRIQLMCDSRDWNKNLTSTLQKSGWEMTGGDNIVTRFQYAAGRHQITARPPQMSGPGWEAAINGQHAVKDEKFLTILDLSEEDIQEEINNGRFPPCIVYKIVYTSPVERRVKPAMIRVYMHGADVPISFVCRVKEELTALPAPPASFEPISGTATSPSPMETTPVITSVADLYSALNHRLDAKWRQFGIFLGVEYRFMESIRKDNKDQDECMLDLLGNWTSCQAGTGTLPRTWRSVMMAVQKTGDGVLAQDLAQQLA